MTAVDLLAYLQQKGVALWVEGNRLRFRAPRGVLTPALRKELAACKSEMMGLLHPTAVVADSTAFSLKPIPRDGKLPLSFAQERQWFVDQLEPGHPFYNIPLAVDIAGALDVAALERSFNEILRRHEVLRTSCSTLDGQPSLLIAPETTLTLPVVDLTGFSETERYAEAKRLATQEARRPFDLAHGPLFRVVLLRISEAEYRLVLTTHHFVADGWSMEVLFRELSILYDAFSRGEDSPLAELPVQYADFAHWQRRRLQGEILETQLAYWKQQLAGAPTVLELPTDRPRPAIQTHQGASRSFSLSRALCQAMKRLSRSEGVTLFMALLAAFLTLLYRYTHQQDIVVGTTVSNRNRIETEGLIGPFANNLLMRTDLTGNPSFLELLARVRETSVGAYANQDLPFERLLKELQPGRDLSRNPLFQVNFVLHEHTLETSLRLSGLTLRRAPLDTGTARVDLGVAMTDDAGKLSGSLVYSTDLFNASTIQRLAGHFQTLLEGITADPRQRISDLPLLTKAERHQVLVEWNDTATDFSKGLCVHQLFEEQVERTPGAIALVFEDEHLTYQALNKRANQLSHHLQRKGVGPDVLVGIYMERSLEMVVGMLGILKAGGAYVPLDPATPKERLRFILEETRAPVLLTEKRLAEGLSEPGPHIVCLDSSSQPACEREKDENPATGVRADNLAYVIFTSGSTGRPKGVMISHEGICNTLLWRQMAFPLTEEDRVLQTLSFAFDASVWEFFAPLMAGARLILPKPGAYRDDAHLIKLIARHEVTILQAVASHLRLLLEERGLESCQYLKRVFCGGEVLPVSLQEQFFGRLDADLVNLYGPTETSIDATSWTCRRSGDQEVVPIGRPIANKQAYVLDAQLNPVPVGVHGELYIGGAGLAVGYLRNAALTAEKFVPDPFSSELGSRLYKTADLCRWLPDGNLEFLGRIDDQTKIRGFLIEPAEVEAVLAGYEGVRETVVMAREDRPGEKRLAAYLVMERKPTFSISDLRAFLKQKLPDFMVPSAFILLDALPHTASGKVDRKALPAPDRKRPELEKAYVAPGTPLERFLAGMWQEALGVDQVGLFDNFFELGGDSIQGAILMNKLQEKLGEYVYTVALFDAPTVRSLSKYLGENYPDSVLRLFGSESVAAGHSGQPGKVDASKVAILRGLVRRLPPLEAEDQMAEPKNPSAVFVLSAPRCGSTLFRVMLGGHPGLFAPPELQLLNFNTLKERRAAFSSDRDRFWLDGTIRAIMEIKNCGVEQATMIMEDCERLEFTTKQFYGLMQEWIREKTFVDKTPTYALDLQTLKRAEACFENPLYIHLVRHPRAMIASFEKAKLQVFFPAFLTDEHPFSVRQLAELIWMISHQNIVEFLKDVPADRQHWVSFEDLVSDPRGVMDEVCQFLGIGFHPDMLEPHKDTKTRMTDPIHPLARMLGDVRFHEHKRIDPEVADRWRQGDAGNFLGDMTWRCAESIGYHREEMTPSYFGEPGKLLFGCYHPPQSERSRRAGVVLCHPVGHEYIQFHRAYRRLADRLSKVGLSVLRFDYYGCGDSAGDFEQGGISPWLADVTTAIDEIRRRGDVSEICLVGLRLGGTLSMMAGAARGPIEAMALWDPVVGGRAYIDRLTSLHQDMLRRSHVRPKSHTTSQNPGEILGFPFTDAMLSDLANLDLLSIRHKPANSILVIQSDDKVDQRPLNDHLRNICPQVDLQHLPAPEIWAWMEDFGRIVMPEEILDAIVSWVSGRCA